MTLSRSFLALLPDCGAHQPQAVETILTAPGEEAQVDYGTGPMVRAVQSGKYRRTRLFVMTLGYSPQIGTLAGIPFQFADVGRTA